MNKIEWNDIEYAARQIFTVWVDQPELKWAQNAWSALTSDGLTSYKDGHEKIFVLVRFFVVAGMYHDFCYRSHREQTEYYEEQLSWLSYLEDCDLCLPSFYLGQILGEYYRPSEVPHTLDDEILLKREVINVLCAQETSLVYSALKKYFGGDSGIFVSLWTSTSYELQMQLNEDKDAYSDHVLSDVCMDKLETYAWIENGMPLSVCAYDIFGKSVNNNAIEDMILSGESDTIEFKESAFQKEKNGEIKKTDPHHILKTVAAFINTKGGVLLIGINDLGKPVGVEEEYAIADKKKNSWDGYSLYLQNKIEKIQHPVIHQLYSLERVMFNDRVICKVTVKPSIKIAYIDDSLFVRSGLKTLSLKGRAREDYYEYRKSGV